MRRHILHSYAEGNNFDSKAEVISAKFSDFINQRTWISGDAWTVNQNRGDEWELGMNLELPNPYEEPEGWFEDIEEIAIFTRSLSIETSLEFALGIYDTESDYSEDLFFINDGPIDIEELKSVIGTKEE